MAWTAIGRRAARDVCKRLAQMRQNPRADWAIADVKAVCTEAGSECQPPRSGGSHYKIYHHLQADILIVPVKRPIKPVSIMKLVGLSTRSAHVADRLEYPILVSPLSDEDGGGFAATVPDLPGCISDGETPEQAVTNVRDAIAMWTEAAGEMGRRVPPPSKRLQIG